jgi:hypothetical protein
VSGFGLYNYKNQSRRNPSFSGFGLELRKLLQSAAA